jgi:hypothetical protein
VSRCCVFVVVLEAANVWGGRLSGHVGVVAGYLILFVVVYYNVEDGVMCVRVRVIDM